MSASILHKFNNSFLLSNISYVVFIVDGWTLAPVTQPLVASYKLKA